MKDMTQETVYVYLDGTPVPDGKRICIDNEVQTFTITIRSLSGVGADTLKNLIQQKYEVTGVHLDKTTFVCRKS